MADLSRLAFIVQNRSTLAVKMGELRLGIAAAGSGALGHGVLDCRQDGETVKIHPDGPLVTTSPDLAIRAAEDGLGWYATFEDFLRPSLEAGRLVEALVPWCPYFAGPSLYYPSRRHVPAPLRAFIDFVRKQAHPAAD